MPFNAYLQQQKINVLERTAFKSGVIGLIDIGSFQTTCIIAQRHSGILRKMSQKTVQSRGIDHGCITHMEKAQQTIKRVIYEAQNDAGKRLKNVFVVSSNARISGHAFESTIRLSNRVVTYSDIKNVLKQACAKSQGLAEGLAFLRVLTTGFSIEREHSSQSGHAENKQIYADPIGLTGKNLRAGVYLMAISDTFLHDMSSCFRALNIDVVGFIPAVYASCLATMCGNTQKAGGLCIDFGANTINFGFFQKGHLEYIGGIDVGGREITNHISQLLSISPEYAEALKIRYGTLNNTRNDDYYHIPLTRTHHHNGSYPDSITRSELTAIIKDVVYTILIHLRNRLEQFGFYNHNSGYILTTGGSSQIQGFDDYASQILERSVNLVRPVPALSQGMANASYASVTGGFSLLQSADHIWWNPYIKRSNFYQETINPFIKRFV